MKTKQKKVNKRIRKRANRNRRIRRRRSHKRSRISRNNRRIRRGTKINRLGRRVGTSLHRNSFSRNPNNKRKILLQYPRQKLSNKSRQRNGVLKYRLTPRLDSLDSQSSIHQSGFKGSRNKSIIKNKIRNKSKT